MRTAEIPILLKKRTVSAGGIVLFDELWPGTAGAALPAGWTVQSGTPTQDGSGHMVFASAGQALRDTGTATYTITAVCKPDNHYPTVVFRSDSAGAVYSMVQVRGDTFVLQYSETPDSGGTGNNVHAGSTFIDTTSGRVEHTIQVIVSGSAVTVKLDGVNEITGITASQGLTNTYAGILWGLAPLGGSYFGEVKATT